MLVAATAGIGTAAGLAGLELAGRSFADGGAAVAVAVAASVAALGTGVAAGAARRLRSASAARLHALVVLAGGLVCLLSPALLRAVAALVWDLGPASRADPQPLGALFLAALTCVFLVAGLPLGCGVPMLLVAGRVGGARRDAGEATAAGAVLGGVIGGLGASCAGRLGLGAEWVLLGCGAALLVIAGVGAAFSSLDAGDFRAAVATPAVAGGRRSRFAASLILVVLTLACLLPFAQKALHIDDPFYVWVAHRIEDAPGDFYGLAVNWYGVEAPLAAVNQNPPLVSFYIALAAQFLGWSEVGLHLAFLVPAILTVLGAHALASRLSARPSFAALALVGMPVFLVSATTTMCDVLLLGLFVWTLYLWMRGIDEGRGGLVAAAGVLAALCPLAKYFGISVMPLAFAYALAKRRRLGGWAISLLLPVLSIAAYEVYTHALYGRGLFSSAAQYAVGSSGGLGQCGERFGVGLVFAGGCVLPAALALPFVTRRRRTLGTLAVGVGAAAAACAAGRLGVLDLWGPGGPRWLQLVHIALFATAAAVLLDLAAAETLRRRSPEGLLLGLWVLGTLVFASLVNWTASGRALLPLAPAAAILIARRLDRAAAVRATPRLPLVWLAPCVGIVVSLCAAWGDFSLAESARNAARRVAEAGARLETRVWFEGHWGFQHYLQGLGGRPVDYSRSRLEAGDLLAVPLGNTNLREVPAAKVSLLQDLEVSASSWVATQSSAAGAGFYSSQWGPLPYFLGPVAAERCHVLLVREGFSFLDRSEQGGR